MPIPVVLAIGGTDPTGAAGVLADATTIASFGCQPCTAITLVSAQNGSGIAAVEPLPASLVVQQLESVLHDYAPTATKTGLLLRRDVIDAVSATADRLGTLVVDPVLVTSTGAMLVSDDALASYRRLLRRAAVVTPNTRELAVLSGIEIDDGNLDHIASAAQRLIDEGMQAVLVTAGHQQSFDATDVLVSSSGVVELHARRIPGADLRGSGCTMASALAAALACGEELEDAARAAKTAAWQAIDAAKDLPPVAGFGATCHAFGR